MKIKVLIIEDDPITVEVIENQLKNIINDDIQLKFANTKDQALFCLQNDDFDLITLDGRLLDGSHGREVLREMRVTQINKTIVYSGENEFVSECLVKGVRAIQKCRSMHELLARYCQEIGLI